MYTFSVRHKSHCLFPFLYDVALVKMDHFILGSGPKPFSQTCVDKVVEFLFFVFLNESV